MGEREAGKPWSDPNSDPLEDMRRMAKPDRHPEPVEEPLRRPLPWAEHEGTDCEICAVARRRQEHTNG